MEYAMEQIQRRINVHGRILESLSALSKRIPEMMLEDGHGDEEKYEQEQHGMDDEFELDSIFTFDGESENAEDENPNVDARVLRKI